MENEVLRLCYCLDENSRISLVLEEKSKYKIDEITLKFENSKELREFYKSQIDSFRNANRSYIDDSERRNNRIESGDIVLLDNQNKRIRVLYNRHFIVFNEIIDCKSFIDYLAKNYVGLYEILDNVDKYSFYNYDFVRCIYEIYKNIYKQLNLLSPDRIYTMNKKNDDEQCDFVGSLFDDEPKVYKK